VVSSHIPHDYLPLHLLTQKLKLHVAGVKRAIHAPDVVPVCPALRFQGLVLDHQGDRAPLKLGTGQMMD
jgi:hypothetical protein